MLSKEKKKNFLFSAFVLLIIYIIISICVLFVFSDKLNMEEIKAVDGIYTEMRNVDNSIKNDFYLNTLVKLVDKEYVMEELRRDTLLYAISVNEKAMSMLLEGWTYSDVRSYIYRCDLDFDMFNNLEPAAELFDLYREFFNNFSEDVDGLNILSAEMSKIVYEEELQLREISNIRNIKVFIVCVSYIGILIFINSGLVNKIFIKKKDIEVKK